MKKSFYVALVLVAVFVVAPAVQARNGHQGGGFSPAFQSRPVTPPAWGQHHFPHRPPAWGHHHHHHRWHHRPPHWGHWKPHPVWGHRPVARGHFQRPHAWQRPWQPPAGAWRPLNPYPGQTGQYPGRNHFQPGSGSSGQTFSPTYSYSYEH